VTSNQKVASWNLAQKLTYLNFDQKVKYYSSIVLKHTVLEFESPSFHLDAILAYKSNVLEMTLIPIVLEIKCPSVRFDVILFFKWNILWP
jgi:hypothetical protein